MHVPSTPTADTDNSEKNNVNLLLLTFCSISQKDTALIPTFCSYSWNVFLFVWWPSVSLTSDCHEDKFLDIVMCLYRKNDKTLFCLYLAALTFYFSLWYCCWHEHFP